jgi:hypothetical protein
MYLEIGALAVCVKVWALTVITTIWSVWLGNVLCCLNPRLQWDKGRGATPWTINFREGKNGL